MKLVTALLATVGVVGVVLSAVFVYELLAP